MPLVLCDAEGNQVASGSAAGATGHVFNPVEREKLSAAMAAIAAQVRAAAPIPNAVTAGITGFGSVVADDVKRILTSAFEIGPDRLTVVDDIMLAYAAVFPPGEGHLVSAGTGQ